MVGPQKASRCLDDFILVYWPTAALCKEHASRHVVAALKQTGSFVTSPTSGLGSKQKATVLRYKWRYTLSVKLSDFIVWHTWQINRANCAVLTGNSAGLRTVPSSRLSHRELRSTLRESHSFLGLSADTTMASSQGTSISRNSSSRWASHYYIPFQIPLLTPHFTLSFLLFG
jgi:hypothetical protein